jgi:hypothetical protein
MPSTDRKLELKAKTSVAQTTSQAAVYAKGLITYSFLVLTLGTVRPIYRTGTPLPSKHPILYISSTNIRTEFFEDAAHTLFFLFKMPFVS